MGKLYNETYIALKDPYDYNNLAAADSVWLYYEGNSSPMQDSLWQMLSKEKECSNCPMGNASKVNSREMKSMARENTAAWEAKGCRVDGGKVSCKVLKRGAIIEIDILIFCAWWDQAASGYNNAMKVNL